MVALGHKRSCQWLQKDSEGFTLFLLSVSPGPGVMQNKESIPGERGFFPAGTCRVPANILLSCQAGIQHSYTVLLRILGHVLNSSIKKAISFGNRVSKCSDVIKFKAFKMMSPWNIVGLNQAMLLSQKTWRHRKQAQKDEGRH